MASRVFWRRSATAAWVYVAVVFGILGTVVAARVLGLEDFGVFVTALAAVGFFQVLLDLTVEEPLTKFGFRYTVGEEWGKLRRLFVRALQLKFAGGVLAALALVLLAPVADSIFGAEGLAGPILVGSLLPLVQAPENVGSTALLLRGRYDLRGAYLAFAMALRLTAIVVAAPMGVTETLAAMVVAQAIATAAVSLAGLAAFRRFPAAPARPLGEDRREVFSFVLQSSVGTGVISLRTTLVPLMLGIVAGPIQVGLFRIAQTPQTGLAAASSPARLVLLTDQTRAWERGRRGSVLAGVRTYTLVAAGLMAVAVPILMLAMPWLVETVFGAEYSRAVDAARIVLVAAAIQFALGWSKSLPVTIGRPRLRIVTHGLEALVVIPLVAVLGSEWGATGAAVAILVATLVFAAAWAVAIARLRIDVADQGAQGGAVTP
ncbi:MAG: lipopolysaccharide biosynthesis protein [Actinobacteria bacterium]|nr:lipopolysaccharide biosynthesis protein [Actinomycetota bacterium]